jgi:hypothetical protein
MKILLQSVRSGKFCKGPQEWTDDKAEALDFLTSDQAIRFAQKHRLPETQVVAQFRDHNYYVHLPYNFDPMETP